MNILSPGVKNSIGATFMLLGFAGIGASAYIYTNPIQEKPDTLIEAKAIIDCKKEAQQLGYSANGKRTIEIVQHGLEEWEKDLAAFSMIMYKCDGFKLKAFCMGRSCEDSKKNYVYGTTMKIRYSVK